MPLPFLKSKASRKDHILAIDLGVRNTKAIHLQRKGDSYQLVNYVIQDAPVYERGLSVEVLSVHIKNVAHAVGGKTKGLVVAIGVTDAIVREAELPLSPVADLRAMVKLNSKNYLQQDLSDYVFDCHIQGTIEPRADAGKVPSKARVLVTGSRKQFVDDIQTACKNAGFGVEHMFPSMLGPANAFELTNPDVFSKEVVALVDLGFKHSSITIFLEGRMCLSRVVGIGGDKLTSGIAETLGVSYLEGENIKVGMADEVQAIMQPLLSPLGRELRASIDFFEHNQDKAVPQVYVSGGTGKSEFIIQTLQNDLMVPCKSWNPSAGFSLALPPQLAGEIEKDAPQLAAVIGAAVASIPPAS